MFLQVLLIKSQNLTTLKEFDLASFKLPMFGKYLAISALCCSPKFNKHGKWIYRFREYSVGFDVVSVEQNVTSAESFKKKSSGSFR